MWHKMKVRNFQQHFGLKYGLFYKIRAVFYEACHTLYFHYKPYHRQPTTGNPNSWPGVGGGHQGVTIPDTPYNPLKSWGGSCGTFRKNFRSIWKTKTKWPSKNCFPMLYSGILKIPFGKIQKIIFGSQICLIMVK